MFEGSIQIFTLIIFAVNTFIFSIYILPQIKIVRNIRSKLIKLIASFREMKENQGKDKDERITRLNTLFEQYEIEYRELDILKNNFLYAIMVIVVLFCIFFIFHHWPESFSVSAILGVFDANFFLDFFALGGIIGIFFLAARAMNQYIPSLAKIHEFGFLWKNLGYRPVQIINDIGLELSISMTGESFLKQNSFIHTICSNFLVVGYRYLFCIYNEKGEILYATCGYVSGEDFPNHRKIEIPISEVLPWYRSESIADIAYHTLHGDLQVAWFVFDPCDVKIENSPLYALGRFSRGANGAYTLAGPTLRLSADSIFSYLIYRGDGMKISSIFFKKLRYSKEVDPAFIYSLERLIERYGKDIIKVKKFKKELKIK